MRISTLLITSTITAILSISFAGCGNPPEPFNYKIKNQHKNISNYEKQQLVNIIIDRNSRLKYKSSNGCVILINNWYKEGWSFKYRENMKNCFSVTNNILKRIDYSSCSNDHGRSFKKCNYISNKLEDYSNFINNLQNNVIEKELQKEISNYQKFIKLYDKANISRKEKIKIIKTSLVDNTKVLPKSVFNQLNKFHVVENSVPNKINLYINYISPNNGKNNINRIARNILGDSISENFNKFFKDDSSISDKFKITSSTITNTVNRYKVTYKHRVFKDDYNKFPTNLTYEIDKVYFNYLPKKFRAKDRNIEVEVINNFKDDYNSIKHIKIYNKTKEFIEIDTISGYYGEDVTDNIIDMKDMKRINISPMSYKIFKTDYSYELLLVNDKNQKVPYGFSIGYKMINQNIIKNLYKVNNYSIKSFN
ncbi:hypothetical protein [Arcobacter sp. YIC-310]|uniref:hypothetical protein n=1 Tax=Arcobacter sp. YIC-310 TaxID=3376632 RepID=UPI003C19004C